MLASDRASARREARVLPKFGLQLTQPRYRRCVWRAAEHNTRAACAPQTNRLLLFVAEETPAADDLGNLRWDHCVPAFVAAGDALEDVS